METEALHKKKLLVPKLRFKEFSNEWKPKHIGSILTIGSGRDYKHLSSGDIPVFGTGGLMTMVDKFLYDGATVCIGRKGTIDRPMYFEGKLWTVDTLFYTHLFVESTPKFVYNLFQKINWKEYNEASGVPSLSKATIEKIKVSIPALPEQQKIASFLSAVDEKIQQLTRKKELLEQYKKGVMQQLFSGKLRFKGHIDKWEKIVFTDCCDLIHGFQFREEHFESTGLPVIKIGSLVDNGSISFHNATYVSKDCENTHSKFILKKGDVLMALTGGTLGKVSRIDKDYGVIFQNYRVGKFENKSNSLREYIYFLLQSRLVQNRVQSLVNEAAQPNFGKQDFDKIRFELPSLSEQQKIADYLSSIDNKIEIVNNQITQTQTFKNGLLQQMFV